MGAKTAPFGEEAPFRPGRVTSEDIDEGVAGEAIWGGETVAGGAE